jgi:hypothetical protein
LASEILPLFQCRNWQVLGSETLLATKIGIGNR